MKMLLDFLPIVLFFAAFKMKGIYFATSVAITAAVIQICFMYFRNKKVEPMMWISLLVLIVFGGSTLLLHNEMFIKWKPTILYWIFAIVLLTSQLLYKKNLIKALLGKQLVLPEAVWSRLNTAWAVFFALIGGLNLFVAYHFSTNTWVSFKLFGLLGFMVTFIIVQTLFLSRYIDK